MQLTVDGHVLTGGSKTVGHHIQMIDGHIFLDGQAAAVLHADSDGIARRLDSDSVALTGRCADGQILTDIVVVFGICDRGLLAVSQDLQTGHSIICAGSSQRFFECCICTDYVTFGVHSLGHSCEFGCDCAEGNHSQNQEQRHNEAKQTLHHFFHFRFPPQF